MEYSFNLERLRSAVGRFAAARVLVLGDVMLDRFIWGRVSRISPEAPVPVVEVQRETALLGGAANVLHNITTLGGQAAICGLCGDDDAGHRVQALLSELGVDPRGVVVSPNRQTTVKTRVVAHSQQVVRVDREDRGSADGAEAGLLRDRLETEVPRCQGVVVSDYAKGVVTRELMTHLMDLAYDSEAIVAVDPKVGNMPFYAGATVITPNHHEALAASGVAGDGEAAELAAGRKLLADLRPSFLLVTQGERGMTLFSEQGETHIPTAAKRVFDVTGAGDTVISTLTLGLCAGLAPDEAALLANLAAGVVVGEVGTSAVTAERLIAALEEASRAGKK